MHNRARRLGNPLTQQPLREYQQQLLPRRHGLVDLAQPLTIHKAAGYSCPYRWIGLSAVLDVLGPSSRAPP